MLHIEQNPGLTSISWAPSSAFLVMEGVLGTIGRFVYFTVGFFGFFVSGGFGAASCSSDREESHDSHMELLPIDTKATVPWS